MVKRQKILPRMWQQAYKLLKLKSYVAESEIQLINRLKLEGRVAKSVARQLTTAALWVRIQTSRQHANRLHELKSLVADITDQMVNRQKILPKE
jgi:hypothetical protein